MRRPETVRRDQLAGFGLESRHADWTGAELTGSGSHVSVYRLGGGAA